MVVICRIYIGGSDMIIFGLKEIRRYGEEAEEQKVVPQMLSEHQAVVTHYNMNPMVMKILVMHSKPSV